MHGSRVSEARNVQSGVEDHESFLKYNIGCCACK